MCASTCASIQIVETEETAGATNDALVTESKEDHQQNDEDEGMKEKLYYVRAIESEVDMSACICHMAHRVLTYIHLLTYSIRPYICILI